MRPQHNSGVPTLGEDPTPRLLLTLLDEERCPWCGKAMVRAYATPGLKGRVTRDVDGVYCLRARCLKALGSVGVLRALQEAIEST